MKKSFYTGLIFLVVLNFTTFAAGDMEKNDHSGHNHESKSKAPVKEHKDHDDHDDHAEKEDHEDHDDHAEDEGHDDHGGGKAIGKGKAITEIDETKGFKLSKEAIKTLKLKLNTVDGDQFKISKDTLVLSKDNKGVYRFRGGFFKFLPAKIVKENKDEYLVKVDGVDFGDQIVVNGVGLLKVADIYSKDKSEYGHAH